MIPLFPLGVVLLPQMPLVFVIEPYLVPERKPSFPPISASDSNFNPPPNFGGLILEILTVFLWLKFSSSLILTKNPSFRSGTI